jgi:hypothetical protein
MLEDMWGIGSISCVWQGELDAETGMGNCLNFFKLWNISIMQESTENNMTDARVPLPRLNRC